MSYSKIISLSRMIGSDIARVSRETSLIFKMLSLIGLGWRVLREQRERDREGRKGTEDFKGSQLDFQDGVTDRVTMART